MYEKVFVIVAAVEVETPDTTRVLRLARGTTPTALDTPRLLTPLKLFTAPMMTLEEVRRYANTGGDVRAHALTRELSPGPPVLWPT